MAHRSTYLMIVLLAATLLGSTKLSGPVLAQDDDSGTVLYPALDYEGHTYTYRLYLPPGYDQTIDDGLPLIIAFHPAGGDGDSMARTTGFDTYAARDNVIVAYPTSQFGYWDYGYGLPEWEPLTNALDDPGFAAALYEELLASYPVDPTHVYLAGYSNGSRLVMRLACDHAEWFAGAAIVAAGLSSEVASACPADSQLPIFYQHGTDDQTVPWEGKPLRDGGRLISHALSAPDTTTFWAVRNGCSPQAAIRAVPDLNPDDSITVRHMHFADCTSGYPVAFYIVLGGGHGWLGAPLNLEVDFQASGDTSAYIWEFFELAGEATSP